jgi:predicted TIM-barrel fold metal-dependent hydrolase
LTEIFDAHVHVWELTEDRYSFDPRFGACPKLEASIDRLMALMHTHGVARAALIQPGNYGFDASLIADIVARDPRRFVGLGMVDPTQAGVADQLSTWIEERGLVGVRVLGRWIDAPHIKELWRRASQLQATLSFITGPIDMLPLVTLLDDLPSTPVVIDHLGHRRPDDRKHCQQLFDLAAYPNVYVKLSGLYALSAEAHPHPDVEWLIREVLQTFGARRLMWASDFPYIVETCGYGACLDLFRRELPLTREEDRDWICGKTAASLWAGGSEVVA